VENLEKFQTELCEILDEYAQKLQVELDDILDEYARWNAPRPRGQIPIFPLRAKRFDPELSKRLDKLLTWEEGAETPSERELWRNLRERESLKIKYLYFGGQNASNKVPNVF
jgi:hypothetical protein